MNDLKVGDLNIHVDRSSPGVLRLDWLGRSDEGNPGGHVAPFFDQALAEASTASLGIEMHFEELTYFNSSCIATLVRLIRMAREKNATMRIYFNAELRWQALTFDVLERALNTYRSFRTGPNVEFLPVGKS